MRSVGGSTNNDHIADKTIDGWMGRAHASKGACRGRDGAEKKMGREGAAGQAPTPMRKRKSHWLHLFPGSVVRMGAKLSVSFWYLAGGEGRNELELEPCSEERAKRRDETRTMFVFLEKGRFASAHLPSSFACFPVFSLSNSHSCTSSATARRVHVRANFFFAFVFFCSLSSTSFILADAYP